MIGVIDYGAGNIASVLNVIEDLNCEYIVTDKEILLQKCDKIIFPGVGEAAYAVKRLHLSNLFTMLRLTKKPLLGICLGMQLLCDKSKEGSVCALGVVPVETEIYDSTKVKVPQMGWNSVSFIKESKLFTGINSGHYFFFANSYYVPLNEYTTGISEYDVQFSAAVHKNNFYGVQFHPEKSGEAGVRLINNFIELC